MFFIMRVTPIALIFLFQTLILTFSTDAAPKDLFYDAARTEQRLAFLYRIKQRGVLEIGNDVNPSTASLLKNSALAIEDTLVMLSHTYNALQSLLQDEPPILDQVSQILERATLDSEVIIQQTYSDILQEQNLSFPRVQALVQGAQAQLEGIAASAAPEIERRVMDLDFDTVVTVHEFLHVFLEEARYSKRHLDRPVHENESQQISS